GEVGMVTPIAFAPHEVVEAAALDHEGRFDVVWRRSDLPEIAMDGAHGGCERRDDAVAVPAEIEIGAAVVIEKAMGIDGLRAMWVVANERPADGISEGTGGGIGDSNAEPGAIARGEVEVVAAILLG